MRSLLALPLLALSWTSWALDSYGINSSGTLFRINDSTNTETFVQNTGLSGTHCLAYNPVDKNLYTISGNTLYRFKPGTTPVVARVLPFFTNDFYGLAISRGGVCYGIESLMTRVWRFGTFSGETLIGATGIATNGFAFNWDGSLYLISDFVDPSLYGIYVVNKNTAASARITTGSQPRHELAAMAARPAGSFGLGLNMAYFRAHTTVSPITGAFTAIGGSFSALRGLAYEYDGPFATVMQLAAVTFGRVDSNNPGCLEDREGDPLRICKFIVPNQSVPPIRFTLQAQIPSNQTTLATLINHRSTTSGSFRMTGEYLNPQTNLFEEVGEVTVGLNRVTSLFVGDASRHVSSNRFVNVRLSLRPVGPVGAATYCLEIDQAVVQST